MLIDVSKLAISTKNSNDPCSGKQVSRRPSLPSFPWSHAFGGNCRTNSDTAELSTNRSTYRSKWARIGLIASSTDIDRSPFTDLDSFGYDQSLVPSSENSDNKLIQSFSANLPFRQLDSLSSVSCSKRLSGKYRIWRPLLLHFDTYFKTYLSCRNDLTLSDNLEDDIPLPKDAILQILRVMQIILENCPNKSTIDGLEHFKLLLASTDPKIIIPTLETLFAFVKINSSKLHGGSKMVGCGSVNGYLLSLAQRWEAKRKALGCTFASWQMRKPMMKHRVRFLLMLKMVVTNPITV